MPSTRPVLVRFLILLLLLRGSIPAGLMPDLAALQTGVLRLVICTATGPQEIAVDATGASVAGVVANGDDSAPPAHPDPSDRPGTDAACPFAGALQPVLHPAPVVAAPLSVAGAVLLPRGTPPARPGQTTTQQPRAPPAILV